MKLIVGLGNPGEKYIHTRHNLGFSVVEKFAKELGVDTHWKTDTKMKAEIATTVLDGKAEDGEKLFIVKPMTYMNLSGMAVGALSLFYKIDPSDIVIVHDELDLPVGMMKIRNGGAAAGNHGVESVIQHLGTDKFWRFRLGIGVSHNHSEVGKQVIRNAEDFVLGTFSHDEAGKVRELIKKSVKALSVFLDAGPERAMNQFNTK